MVCFGNQFPCRVLRWRTDNFLGCHSSLINSSLPHSGDILVLLILRSAVYLSIYFSLHCLKCKSRVVCLPSLTGSRSHENCLLFLERHSPWHLKYYLLQMLFKHREGGEHEDYCVSDWAAYSLLWWLAQSICPTWHKLMYLKLLWGSILKDISYL